ncbi:MAG: hypothetical protein WC197_00075 [Candidatus Gastranaerophilaceae bacterium]|jgi:hypothetical protein
MDTVNNSINSTNTNNKSLFIKISLVVLVLFLMFSSFGAGLVIAEYNSGLASFTQGEAKYLGEIIGKYNDSANGRLSDDVDFKIFWETWDTLKSSMSTRTDSMKRKCFMVQSAAWSLH